MFEVVNSKGLGGGVEREREERGKRAREGRVFIINVMGREVVVVVKL